MRRVEEKTFADRLLPIIERFSPVLSDLVAINPKAHFPANYWAALKLYCFAAYIHTCYVPIISKNSFVKDNFYFVDLLSSAGINWICDKPGCEAENCSVCKHEKYPVVGSSLIAATANPPFKKIFSVDISEERLAALGRRVALLKANGMCNSEFVPKNSDCNTAVDEIIRELRHGGRPYHFLAVVDNQGLDAEWATIEKLLNCEYCDIIINFPTSVVIREAGKSSLEKLKKFLGFDSSSKDLALSDLIGYYTNKLKLGGRNGKTVETIRINTGIPYHYDLIMVTKHDAGFSKVISHIKRSVEKNSAAEAKTAFRMFYAGQKGLKSYF